MTTREYAVATTAIAVSAVWTADRVLTPTFVAPGSHAQQPTKAPMPATSMPAQAKASLSNTGLLAYGMGGGALMAMVGVRSRKVARRAEGEIAVAEKTETKPVSYLENIPRTIMEKAAVEKLLSSVPKEQWENPPEDSYLYELKCYAETYGPGKATKMGWYDWCYMKVNQPGIEDIVSGEQIEKLEKEWREVLSGKYPLYVPGPSGFFPLAGATLNWRPERELFAGDQVRTWLDGKFAQDFLNNWAFYREGLKPWQRGIEIGMAHGYFLIGPFVTLGPLRNTPEAATVGLLCGAAVVGLVSVGGLIFGATQAPTRFDEPGAPRASGFQEMINWHAVGGLGGAGFAHALLVTFGGY